jgi:hypothetical protein
LIGSEGVRVLIGATTGPIEVTRLLAIEDEIAQSMVCLDRTTHLVPISRGYDAFVKAGSGIVQNLYGHGRFRLDVSASIDAGESWQAGVLLAHALADKGRLAIRGTEAGTVAWATGTVHVDDLSIGQVGAVDEKLRASLAALRQARIGGARVIAFLPAANLSDMASQTRDALAAADVTIVPLGITADMLRALGLPASPPAEAQTPPSSPGKRHWRSVVMTLGGLVAVASIVVAGVGIWRVLDPGRRIAAVRDAGKQAEREASAQAYEAMQADDVAEARGRRSVDAIAKALTAWRDGDNNFARYQSQCAREDIACLANYRGEKNPWRFDTQAYRYAGWMTGGDPGGYGRLTADDAAVEGLVRRDGNAFMVFGRAGFNLKAAAQETLILGDVTLAPENGQLRPTGFSGVMEVGFTDAPAPISRGPAAGDASTNFLLTQTTKRGAPLKPLFAGRFTADPAGGGRYLGAAVIGPTELNASIVLGPGGSPLDLWPIGGLDIPLKLVVGLARLPTGVLLTGLYWPGDRQAYGSLKAPDGSTYYGQIRFWVPDGCGVKVDPRGKVLEAGVYVRGKLTNPDLPGNCAAFTGFPAIDH